MTPPSIAITTAADRRFLWGLYLLAATLRRNGVRAPLHCLTVGLTEDERSMLQQFDAVEVSNLSKYTHSGNALTLSKPDALALSSHADVVWWMDADCIVTGDVSPYLLPQSPGFHARFREPAENLLRFRAVGQNGGIPQGVLEIWRRDVGQRDQPRINTTCSANAFAIHREHRGFVDHWRDHVHFLLNRYNDNSPEQRLAYLFSGGKGFSDEMILNSLLVFANDAPPITEYQLDKDPNAKLVHFALNPKPWVQWPPAYIQHYEAVVTTIEWARDAGLRTPPVPPHFERANRDKVLRQTRLRGLYHNARRYVRTPGRYLKDRAAARRIRAQVSE